MNFLPKKSGTKPIAASALAFFAVASLALAGSLTPPGAPGSTMNTLAEIYDTIAGAFDSTGVVADQNGSLLEHLKYIEANMGTVGGGWTDDGTVVRLTTITDNVGIGTTTPNNKLQVAGLISFDDAGFNTALGFGALAVNTGLLNTAVGYQALLSNTTGNANTANGYQALNSNTTGSVNTATGAAALAFNTTGRANTANGVNALNENTTGSFNTADGGNTLISNTTGNLNTANGAYALESNETGSFNTAIGTSALILNVTGDDNVAVGASAGFSFAGSGGVFIGRSAGYSTTTGANNTAVGFQSLFTNTTGSENTANGYQALFSNDTGYLNTANGYQALFNNTTGAFNTANGSQALLNNTTGDYNTADGANALRLNTTGTQNTANGAEALSSNTTGNYNTAVGTAALQNNITGDGNTAVGQQALTLNFTGSFNTATGKNVLNFNTAGSFNTANGYFAMGVNDTGSFNTANGYNALYLNDTGSFNTADGTGALYLNITGDNNIAIGASAGYSALGSGNVFLGRSAGYSETGSNRLYIDNSPTTTPLIYGEFDNNFLSFGGSASIAGNFGPSANDTYDLGSDALRWRDLYLASGSLHIGVSGDEAVIDYNVTDDYLAFKPDGTLTRMVIQDGGNVGIGTSDPQAQMDIYSGTNDALHLTVDNDSPYALIINNLTVGNTDADGFGFWQDNNGTGHIDIEGTDVVQIASSGQLVAPFLLSPRVLGFVDNPADFRAAVGGQANIVDASLTSNDVVAVNGGVSFQDPVGTTDRALAGSFVTVTLPTAGGTLNNAVGVNGVVQALGATNVINAYGGLFGILSSGSTAMTNAYGVNISSLQLGNPYTGTVTNNYGIYINDQAGLATGLNYNIYSAGAGDNFFDGRVLIGSISEPGPLASTPAKTVIDGEDGTALALISTDWGVTIRNPDYSGYALGLYQLASGGFALDTGVTGPTARRTVVDERGNMAVGNDNLVTVNYKLEVASESDEDIFRLKDSDGDCFFNPETGSLITTCPSDARLKKNIVDSGSALDYLAGFRIRDFTVIKSGERKTGVIAQELRETHPELVAVGPNGLLGVQEPNSWILLKAIQELDGKIEDLAAEGPMTFDEQGLFERFLAYIRDAVLTVKKLTASDQVCIGSTCVDEEQLKALLDDGDVPPQTDSDPEPSAEPSETPESTPEPSAEPEQTPSPEPEATSEPTPEPTPEETEPTPEPEGEPQPEISETP